MTIIDDAFLSLFFGQGAILGYLLILVISVSLIRKWKVTGALVLPIVMLLNYEYYIRMKATPVFGWYILATTILGVFVALYAIFGKDERR